MSWGVFITVGITLIFLSKIKSFQLPWELSNLHENFPTTMRTFQLPWELSNFGETLQLHIYQRTVPRRCLRLDCYHVIRNKHSETYLPRTVCDEPFNFMTYFMWHKLCHIHVANVTELLGDMVITKTSPNFPITEWPISDWQSQLQFLHLFLAFISAFRVGSDRPQKDALSPEIRPLQ